MTRKEPDRGGSMGPGAADVAITQYIRVASPHLIDFEAGKITREELVTVLKPKLDSVYGNVLEMERQAVAKADDKLGIESLTTDTCGAHDLNWFKDSGKAFATGLATTAFAVAIIHKDIGMSAAHRNLITTDDVMDIIITAAKSNLTRGMIEVLDDASLKRMLVSNERQAAMVSNTMKEAMDAFVRLTTSGIPISGTQICLVGGSFLSHDQVNELMEKTVRAIKQHPAMNDGNARQTGRRIALINKLGEKVPQGVMWGGPQHPLYSQPTLYTTQNLSN